MKSVYIKRSNDLTPELFMQPSEFFPYIYFMTIELITLFTILLVGLVIKCYQLPVKYKKDLQVKVMILKGYDWCNIGHNQILVM